MIEAIIILALIFLNGLFAMSEIAVISSRKSKLRLDAKNGSKSAKAALKLAENPTNFLSTVQIGITLIGILTGLYSGEAFANDLAKVLSHIGLNERIAFPLAKFSIVIVVTFTTLIFGELVPKRIGMSISEKTAKAIAAPMNFLSVVASPFVWLLSKCSSLIFNTLNLNLSENKVTEEEIKSLIQEGTEGGEVQTVEQDIVERVFTLGDRKVASIMTHRSEIDWIDINSTNREISDFIQQHPHYIYPVADKNMDEILGITFLKDVFGKLENPDFHLKDIVRAAPNFHENMEVYRALEEMKSNHYKYALIYDEFGNFQGVVTLKDIFEALIGSIPSESEEPDIIESQKGSWLVDGKCSFYDFLDYFEMEELYPKYEYNTISGLALDKLQHIPRSGETFHWNIFSFEIVGMDGARIDKILVKYS